MCFTYCSVRIHRRAWPGKPCKACPPNAARVSRVFWRPRRRRKKPPATGRRRGTPLHRVLQAANTGALPGTLGLSLTTSEISLSAMQKLAYKAFVWLKGRNFNGVYYAFDQGHRSPGSPFRIRFIYGIRQVCQKPNRKLLCCLIFVR